jgi:hypothetical protein
MRFYLAAPTGGCELDDTRWTWSPLPCRRCGRCASSQASPSCSAPPTGPAERAIATTVLVAATVLVADASLGLDEEREAADATIRSFGDVMVRSCILCPATQALRYGKTSENKSCGSVAEGRPTTKLHRRAMKAASRYKVKEENPNTNANLPLETRTSVAVSSEPRARRFRSPGRLSRSRDGRAGHAQGP